MNVYRIARIRHATLDGKGAAIYPGRWNKRDFPCVYTSSSPALAQLEIMVNANNWSLLAVDHLVMTIRVPDARIHMVRDNDLPPRWADAVYPSTTQELGAKLLAKTEILAFGVPSAVSKTERNIILNPRVAGFSRLVKITRLTPFRFDRRLLKNQK